MSNQSMDKSHLNDGTTTITIRLPEEYKSRLNTIVESNHLSKKQWIISCIERDSQTIEKKRELLKSISGFKDSIFFLKAYTTLDRDKKRAKQVLHSLNDLDKTLEWIIINFS